VGEIVSEIAAASSGQAHGIEQINKAVEGMDKIAQQNAANAEESASASEELSAQAVQMKEIVAALVKLIGENGERDFQKGLTQNIQDSLDRSKAKGRRKETLLPHSAEVSPDKVIPMDKAEFKNF
jgi:methyl-accepting chemotaxis protein